ncbi:MAG TPA: ATP-binding protein, partial [Trebonia sp.]
MPAGMIVVLGRVGLGSGDRPAELRRQLRMALALMVAARGRRVRREEIASAVWEDEDHDVRTLMWSLRRALRDSDCGLDVPPDKGRDGSYRLALTGAGRLEDAVDAFRFLELTGEAEALWRGGDEAAAAGRLTAAAGWWGGEPFADLWPDGLPQSCRRLAAELGRARDFLVAALAEAALREGAPYGPARVFLGRPVGGAGDRAPGGAVAWLAAFAVALHDGPGTGEAQRLLAERRAGGGGQEGHLADRAVGRADDLLLMAESGIGVHRPLTVEPRPPVAGSPLRAVGRESELAAFGRLADAVTAGRPAVLAVRGPSGRGKTRLAGEFAAAAVTAGIPVVLVAAGPPGDVRPWPEFARRLWPAACRSAGLAGGAGPLAGAPGGGRLPARLSLGQRRVLLDLVAPRAAGVSRPDPDQAQDARFAEIAGALGVLARYAAAGRGLVLVLDDADRLTGRGRELLRLLLADLRDAPVGVALLGRDDGPDDGAWTEAVAAVRGDTVPLRLGPLAGPAVGCWLGQLRGREPDGDEVRRVVLATGGEPIRIADQAAAVLSAGRRGGRPGPGEESPVPLPWLAAAAITASDLVIDTALVAGMLELPDAEADLEEFRACGTGWVDSSAGVRFTHGSHRDEVIARLDADPALRRSLHRRAFAVLAGRARDEGDPDPGLPVRVAGHALGADRDLPAGEAARAFLAAARAERASGEAAEAWARAGIARAAAAGRAVSGGGADPAVRAGLHLVLGDALDQRGAVTAADAEYQLACDIAVAWPLERAEALIRLARRWTDPGKVDWYLLHGLQDGIAALDGRADDAAVALRWQLTAHLARKSTLAVPVLGSDADELRQRGVALARAAIGQAGALPPAAACEVLHEGRWALYDYEPPAETVRLSGRLERTSLLARSPYFQREALMTLVIDQLRLGQVTGAQGTLLAHERTRPASLASRWLQLTVETLLDLWHGRFAAAETRLFTVAAPIVARAHAEQEAVADTLQQTWQGQVFWLRRERGERLRETDPEVFRQIEGHAFFPVWRVALAVTACDEGDLASAAAHVRGLYEEYGGFAAFPPHGWTVSVAALLAEACLAM